MSKQTITVEGGDTGFIGLLTLLFIGLRLGGAIDWSWWWVLAPIWEPIAVCAVIAMIAIAVVAIVNAWKR